MVLAGKFIFSETSLIVYINNPPEALDIELWFNVILITNKCQERVYYVENLMQEEM